MSDRLIFIKYSPLDNIFVLHYMYAGAGSCLIIDSRTEVGRTAF